jgi:hypothetical protein
MIWSRRSVLLGSTLLVAAAWASRAAAAGSGYASPARQTCDCCKLPCIEAEILKAQEQRAYYADAAKRKSMTAKEYEAGEDEAASKGERERVKYLPGLETCNYYDANLADPIEMRSLTFAGFVFESAGGTIVRTDYTLKTNLETCSLSEKARQYSPMITPCEGIGAAHVTHEEQHIRDCEERREKKLPPRAPWQIAADEVRGYDAEIAKLEDLRFVTAAQCKKASCKSDEADWQRAADELILSVEDVLARGPHKEPSPSPTARKKSPKGK